MYTGCLSVRQARVGADIEIGLGEGEGEGTDRLPLIRPESCRLLIFLWLKVQEKT